MVDVKPEAKTEVPARWNKNILETVETVRGLVTPGREVFVEMGANGLAVVKSGTKCGVTNGKRMVLDIQFESVVILENGWMVACKYGIYDLYDKEGNVYKGLSFLNKQNAIRFASSL